MLELLSIGKIRLSLLIARCFDVRLGVGRKE